VFTKILGMVFSHTGTSALDQQNIGAGTGTAAASAAITTTGTADLVLGEYGDYSGTTLTSPLIGGAAAGGSQKYGDDNTTIWYKILTDTMTAGTASATAGTPWICNVISFKATL
jgi:hypothetical protein